MSNTVTLPPPAPVRMNRRTRLRLAGLLFPGVVWLVLFFTIPIGSVLLFSFYSFDSGVMIRDFTLENYERALGTEVYRKVLFKSLTYGVVVTAICLVVGYPVAYFLARANERMRGLLFIALIIPFWTSIVIRTFAWKILLGSNGFVNFVLRDIGLIDLPIKFLYTQEAVIIGLTHVFLPFMILPLYAVLEKIDPAHEEAAMDLGANRLWTFMRVTLPLSLPGISTGCLLVFLLTIGSFLTPDILGGPGELMISNIIRDEYYVTFNWPFGGTLAALFLGLTLLMIFAYNKLFKFNRTEER
jgi:spermidine/putrescine transport system permease protein